MWYVKEISDTKKNIIISEGVFLRLFEVMSGFSLKWKLAYRNSTYFLTLVILNLVEDFYAGTQISEGFHHASCPIGVTCIPFAIYVTMFYRNLVQIC